MHISVKIPITVPVKIPANPKNGKYFKTETGTNKSETIIWPKLCIKPPAAEIPAPENILNFCIKNITKNESIAPQTENGSDEKPEKSKAESKILVAFTPTAPKNLSWRIKKTVDKFASPIFTPGAIKSKGTKLSKNESATERQTKIA